MFCSKLLPFRSTYLPAKASFGRAVVLATALGFAVAGYVSAQDPGVSPTPLKRTGPSARRDAGMAPAKGQAPAPAKPVVTLAEARELFARVDQDKNGELSIREADYAGLPASRTSTFDTDGNGSLSPDEYLVAFQQSLSTGERRAGADLEAESARIQARRRAQEAERERAQGPSEVRNKAGEAKDALEQRIRQAEVDQRLKEKAKSDLDTRIDNALNPGAGGGPSQGRSRPGETRPPSTQPTPEEARAAREAAEQRLREAEAASRRSQDARRVAPPETVRPAPTPPAERPPQEPARPPREEEKGNSRERPPR